MICPCDKCTHCLCDKCTHIDGCPAKAEHDGVLRCSAYKTQEQTNEEWFCGLSTEDKAEVIAEKIKHAQLQYVPTYGTFTNSDWWEEWLKQPHTFK